MGSFLEQAKHNEQLLDLMDSHFPNQFFDWKVTITFYTCVHYMNEYLCAPGRDIHVRDHYERNSNLNPNSQISVFPLPENLWDMYHDLYIKSRAVRYNGIKNRSLSLKKWEADYKLVREHLKALKEFVESNI